VLGSVVPQRPFSFPIPPLLVAASPPREQQELEWISKALIPPEAAQGCGGTTPPCYYNMNSTNVEGTTPTCCARYRSRGVS